MADTKLTDHNATQPDGDNSGLRGGTQGGGSGHLIEPGGPAGGTPALSPNGVVYSNRGTDSPQAGGTRTADRELDAEDMFEGSRRTSHAEGKQRARDDADVNTQPGTPHDGLQPATPSHSPAGKDRVSSTTRGGDSGNT